MKPVRIMIVGLLAATLANPAAAATLGIYTFENSDATDSSGNGADGIVNAGVSFVAGAGRDGGTVAQFTPTAGTSGISLPININPSVTPSVSLSAWVYAFGFGTANDTFQQDMGKVFSHDDGGFDRTVGFDFRGDDAGSNHSIFNGNGVLDAPGTGVLNSWTHITATYDGTDAKLYLNGTLVASGADHTTDGLATLWVGANPSFNEDFDGYIDDVMVFDTALTETEVGALYDPAPVPLPAGGLLLLGGLGGLALMRRKKA